MRKKDIKKIQNIKQAVLQLCYTEGLSNLTTARIAKEAGVSPATIYLNYNDKIDLLSRLFEEVQLTVESGLQEYLSEFKSIDDKICQTILFINNQCEKYPKESLFMNLMAINQDLLDKKAIEARNKINPVLYDLIQEINLSDKYVNVSTTIIEQFFTIPSLLATNKGYNLNNNELNTVTNMIIKAIHK